MIRNCSISKGASGVVKAPVAFFLLVHLVVRLLNLHLLIELDE